MAGSWEIGNQGSVLVGILHTEQVSMAWALGLRNLAIPGALSPISGRPFDDARNCIAMAALDRKADYLFFLDSDVIPPNDAILRLMAHGLPIVSGVYARRSPPHMLPVMLRGGRWLQPNELPPSGLIEVDLVGAGCLLIRRDVLEKMPPQRPQFGKHWFDWKVDAASLLPPGEALSEDFSFNIHARRTLGIKTLVDCGIVCRHVGLAEALPGIFRPCETTPNT